MKKSLSLLFVFIFLISAFSFNVNATNSFNNTQQIEYYTDGTYAVITIEYENSNRATQTITRTKVKTIYDGNDDALFACKITASFTYNGTTSTCTSASTSYTIYDDVWKVKSATATKSGNKATGNFTVKRYLLGIPIATKDVTVTLTCSPNGTVS